MSSTPKHVAMYNAFGWEPPKFAHIALLVDKDRQKLSKRMGHTNIRELMEEGIFPEALTNFVALLGWSHSQKSDVMSLEDLVQNVRPLALPTECLLIHVIGKPEVYKR